MKRFTSLIVLFFAFSQLNLLSQDIIYKADGSAEEAKVILVGDDEIQYKKFSNPDGPVYVLDKRDVLLITYENGDYDMITSIPAHKDHPQGALNEGFAPNLLNHHFLDIMYGDVTFSYERILGSGIVGIHIPFGFGYAYDLEFFEGNDTWVKNKFFSGFGLNFYPSGQSRWRYFVGPKMLVGYGKQEEYYVFYDEYGNFMYSDYVDNEGIYFKYMVDNGVRFNPLRNSSVAAILSVGVRFFPEAGDSYEIVRPTGHFGMNLSYCF